MTTPPTAAERRPEIVTRGVERPALPWIETASSADHKTVAKLFLGTSLTFLFVALIMFVLTRLQLSVPENTLLGPEIADQIATQAGLIAVVLFALPFIFGLFGYIVPLQVGARGVALPRLNQLGYWLYAGGAFTLMASFLYTPAGVGFGAMPPLSSDLMYSPGQGVDTYIAGAGMTIAGLVCAAINMIVTLRTMRAPGMVWRRAPLLSWAANVISWLVFVTGPIMIAALTMLLIDRRLGGVFFDAPEGGAPLLYEHMAWIFFAASYAAIVIAAAGIISEILQTAARKPIFSHRTVGAALVAIAVLTTLAWMQNMYSAPIPQFWKYVAMLFAVALVIPIGLLVFTWIKTLSGGTLRMTGAVIWSIAAISTMVIGLAGELMYSVIPVGWQLANTTAAQADSLMVLAGGVVFGGFAALHHWLPKISGRMVGTRLSAPACALAVIGLHLFLWPMFLAGLTGQPADLNRFFEGDDVSAYYLIAAIGAGIFAIGVIIELANLARSYTAGTPAGHDPWGATTLEWFTLSPPPAHNFDAVPDVRSAEPLRDIREAIAARRLVSSPATGERTSEPAPGAADGAPVA